MSPGKRFLSETETVVLIISHPSTGKRLASAGGRVSLRVLSDPTGGVHAIVERQIPSGPSLLRHVRRRI